MTTADDALSPSAGNMPTHHPRRPKPPHTQPSPRARHQSVHGHAQKSNASPADMPRHRSDVRDQQQRISPARRQWVVVETLSAGTRPSVIVDGSYRRHFANVNRVSIATSAAVARRLQPVVDHCAISGQSQLDIVQLPSGTALRIVAVPVIGPDGRVYGVGLWTGAMHEATPPIPPIGTIEWTAHTGTARTSLALEHLLGVPATKRVSERTLPDLMARFDRCDDRINLLALFDPSHPVGSWTGTAATRFTDTGRRHLYIAARTASHQGAARIIRGIVCDISDIAPPPAADLGSMTWRHVPTKPGHAVGIVDINTWLIHEWITVDHPMLNSWLHQSPELHPDDTTALASARTQVLDTGQAMRNFRLRFRGQLRWLQVRAEWTRMSNDDRPQALMDAFPCPPISIPLPPVAP
ncbi:GAF domain-containing protein [Nocardia sp. NPDC050175]|uniref:GAF domain-containing protein n=1 Tax=Nocardia sp. NPDC050175 TaxID=3364317 RepID=UPI0037B6B78A